MALNIIICGGGIGGLTAAGYLRASHNVTVLEQSDLEVRNDYGLTIVTNAFALLQKSGITLEELDGVNLTTIWSRNPENQEVVTIDFRQYGIAPSVVARRSKLQQALTRLATDPQGPGRPATIVPGARVVDMNADEGRVTLADGRVFQGDLIIGADGLTSKVRAAVCQQPSGLTAVTNHDLLTFQTQVSLDVVKSDLDLSFLHDSINQAGLASFAPQDTTASTEIGGAFRGMTKKKVLVYHVSPTEVQVAGFALESEFAAQFDEARTSILSDIPVERVVREYEGQFSPSIVNLFRHSKIDAWRIRDIEPVQTWWRGRAVLLGDAVHAVTPHAGQGCNITIEDAEALAYLLQDVKVTDDLTNTFEQYVALRKDRTQLAQRYSRQLGNIESHEQKAQGLITQQEWDGIIYSWQGAEHALATQKTELTV